LINIEWPYRIIYLIDPEAQKAEVFARGPTSGCSELTDERLLW
jgi:hypothetical protein